MAHPIKDQILDAAETRIRTGGYHGFSFREIANDVGIKSSSVHYHFPTKTDLAAAAAQRYTQRFLEALGDPLDQRTALQKWDALKAAFRRAMTEDGLMCLCGVLAAEGAGLPGPVGLSAREFFDALTRWLRLALSGVGTLDVATHAAHLLATLEGALLVARTLGNVDAFDKAVHPCDELLLTCHPRTQGGAPDGTGAGCIR